jgi:hypothetical protein
MISVNELQDKDFFPTALKHLEHSYTNCINPSGDYVEKYNNFKFLSWIA